MGHFNLLGIMSVAVKICLIGGLVRDCSFTKIIWRSELFNADVFQRGGFQLSYDERNEQPPRKHPTGAITDGNTTIIYIILYTLIYNSP